MNCSLLTISYLSPYFSSSFYCFYYVGRAVAEVRVSTRAFHKTIGDAWRCSTWMLGDSSDSSAHPHC